MKRLSGFIAGVLFTLVLSFIFVPSLAANLKTIEVGMNTVNISLNGRTITTSGQNYVRSGTEGEIPQSLNYQGTVYLPLRRMAEILNLDVDYNSTTKTIVLINNVYNTNTDTSTIDFKELTQEETSNVDISKIPVYDREVPSTINDYEDFKSMWTIEYNTTDVFNNSNNLVNYAIYRSNKELLKSTWNKTSLEYKALYAEQLVKEKWEYNYKNKDLTLTFVWADGELGTATCFADGSTTSNFSNNSIE